MDNLNISHTAIENISSLRNQYLKSLPEFQELFIEMMIADSDYFLLQIKDDIIGYVIRNNEGALIEFYIHKIYVPESSDIFASVVNELSITDILCKTFDSLMLSSCLIHGFSYSILGVLYRDVTKPRIKKDKSICMENADLSSRNFLLEQDDSLKELYETEQLLTRFLLHENVFLFKKSGEFIGCGMVIRTKSGWNYCDLGVWVHPEHRQKGIGAQIIILLREYALKNNLTPSCGCAIENTASQKAIEKSGFVSRYKIVKFNPFK